MNMKNNNTNSTIILRKIRENKPIVHQITNYVTVRDCANVVLALGGSPIMADAQEEMQDIVRLSNALVINIGTLNDRTRTSMLIAGQFANKLGIPIILDPVGAGASTYRTQTVQHLLSSFAPAVIRGNLSEIRSVAGLSNNTSGVDVSETDHEESEDHCEELALNLSRKLECIIAISGAVDVISDGRKVIKIHNGHPLLTQITGTGCMSTAMIGACCAVTDDYLNAAATAILTMGIAGDMASVHTGLGSFYTALFDAVSNIDGIVLEQKGDYHVIEK